MASSLEITLRWKKTMKELALQVTKARMAKGWTPSDLAREADMAKITVQAIEDGDYSAFDIGDLVKVAKALGKVVDVKFVKETE